MARQPFDSRGHQPDIRGATLTDVLDALSLGWTLDTTPPRYPILLELPRVGEGA